MPQHAHERHPLPDRAAAGLIVPRRGHRVDSRGVNKPVAEELAVPPGNDLRAMRAADTKLQKRGPSSVYLILTTVTPDSTSIYHDGGTELLIIWQKCGVKTDVIAGRCVLPAIDGNRDDVYESRHANLESGEPI